jgi:hypothetical protein
VSRVGVGAASGGKAADYIIDYLRRPLLNYRTVRSGKLYTTPEAAPTWGSCFSVPQTGKPRAGAV